MFKGIRQLMERNAMYGKIDFGRLVTVAALALTLALTVSAVSADEPSPGDTPEARRKGAEAQLHDAQERLEQAAREIAELSARLVGDAGVTALARIEALSRRARPVMLGVTVGPVGDPAARSEGVQVLSVTPGSSAAEVGIQSGDVLVSLGDGRLDWSGDTSPTEKLLEGLGELEPGNEFRLGFARDGRETVVQVQARERPGARRFVFNGETLDIPSPPLPPDFMRRFMVDRWGDMELVSLTPGLGEYFKVQEGVLVVRAPADPALGLRDGDVIVEIAGRKPADPGHVIRILRSYSPGERLVMTVVRQGRRQQLEADIPG